MDVLTKPQNWIDLHQRPTTDLLRVWETRDLDIWSKELIHDVHQVLVSRNVIKTVRSPHITTWGEILEMPVSDAFIATQIIKGKKNRRWVVNLLEDNALFFCKEDGEEFRIDREKSRKEFIFQKSGFMLLKEGSTALVQGMQFDFSGNKEKLFSWMPKLAKHEVKQSQHIWGVIFLIAGVFSLLLPALINPFWASVLIGLGLLYLLFTNKALFLIDGISLICMGLINTYFLLTNFVPSMTSAVSDLIFYAGYCLCMIVLGFSEIRKFSKFNSVH
jgi:hypothetical protein